MTVNKKRTAYLLGVVLVILIVVTAIFISQKSTKSRALTPENFAQQNHCRYRKAGFDNHIPPEHIEQYNCYFGDPRLSSYEIQLPPEGFYFRSNYLDACEGDEIASTETLLEDLEDFGLTPSLKSQIEKDLSQTDGMSSSSDLCEDSFDQSDKECFIQKQYGDFFVFINPHDGYVYISNESNIKTTLGDHEPCPS